LNQIRTLADSLRSSYWFIPSLFAVGAIAVAAATLYADRYVAVPQALHRVWWLYGGEAAGARLLLSTIAGSVITVTSVTFSITVAAFSLASQQYGPRLLRGFLRDTTNQVVLGVFVATFLYCLVVLRTVRGDFVPSFSITLGTILAIASVVVLIFFIHHVTLSIQSDHIINSVGKELDAAIRRIYPDEISGDPPNERSATFAAHQYAFPARRISTQRFGYVTLVDVQRVAELASLADIVVEIAHEAGSYVEPGACLMSAYPANRVSDKMAKKLERACAILPQRSMLHDADFGAKQLVEVAVRALSPGINNPYTAVMVLERLATSFTRLAQRRTPLPYVRDEAGVVRVVTHPLAFSDLLRSTLEPIRYYGSSSRLVVDAMLAMIAAVTSHARREDDVRALERQARKTRAARDEETGND
jgi:uncharacterized membrane protein